MGPLHHDVVRAAHRRWRTHLWLTRAGALAFAVGVMCALHCAVEVVW